MVYGAINRKGERFYTFLPRVFDVIGNEQLYYNWLVTDCDCNIPNEIWDACIADGYCWISGEKLTELVREHKIQWIFAVFSGFEQNVSLEEVLREPLPFADENVSLWNDPVQLQHPLAHIEIVPWDSSMTIMVTKEKKLYERFRAGFPLSEDFSEYIERSMEGE